jgi:hypothetical protein
MYQNKMEALIGKAKRLTERKDFRKRVVVIHVVWDDNFTCDCGNQASLSGFYPCDRTGNYCEPDERWEGHYKCDDCNQLYKEVKEKEERQ